MVPAPMRIRIFILAALALTACGGSEGNHNRGGDDDAADSDGSDGDAQDEDPGDTLGDPLPGDGSSTGLQRHINTSCDLAGPVATPVFSGLSAFQLTYMAPVPGVTGYLVLSEQRGRILVFPREDYAAGDEHEVMDLGDRVFNNGEKGLHSFAFAPDFDVSGGYLYVMYSINAPGSANDQDSRIERYTCTRDAILTCDPDSGRTVIEIERPNERANHNGGQIFFDGDGYLYITMGDSGGGGDPDGWAQDLSRLQGKILRIDPSQDDGPLHYTVPADNPFVATSGAAPEIWAYGLRNPWRASFDPSSGRIFLADVGQYEWEEVDIIEPGNNYGWNLREGTHAYSGSCPTCTDPIHEYGHTLGRVSITGGFVYRGSQIPSLAGAYVFADYLTGEIFRLDEDMGTWTANRIMTTGAPITSFGYDDIGELYALHNDGTIHRVAIDDTDSAPPTLTDTGCYSDVTSRTLIDAAVPYDLRVPFWSDGAEKKRYFILPGTTTIDADASAAWSFPVGTILIKEFELQEVAGDPTSVKPIETRFLVQRAQGVWKGFSYIWNAGATEASLRPDTELVADYTLNGAPHQHVFPDRVACNTCHTPNGGFVLGLRTENVDRDRDYGAGLENQIAALELAGFFTTPISSTPASVLAPLDDAAASSGLRARSWLAANCSQCHSGSANGGRFPDMRFATSLEDSELCDFIVPGSSGTSPLISERAGIRGAGQMPPLATLIPDDDAMLVLAAWIDAMDDVPPVLPADLICP